MFLRLFGPPTLRASNAPDAPVLLPPGKPVAVLAYLACEARAVSRDELLDLLWATADPERARQSLRQALTQLRRVLGARVRTTGDTVRLDGEVPSDIAGFNEAIAAGAPERALTWAAAPFVAHFATPGGAAFERWADGVRARYDAALARSRELVARGHLAAGRLQDARAVARAAVEGTRDREAAARLLLEVLIAADDRLGAAVEHEALVAWLAAEARAPEPKTRRLLDRARRLWSEAPPPEPSGTAPALRAPELVGREHEFALLLEQWSRVRRGAFARVHVVGPPGVGKSRLIVELGQRLRAAGATVATVRAHPGARHVSGVVLGDVAEALARLPGALGIPEPSAAALVELAPRLSDVYRAAPRRAGSSDASRERHWLQAVDALAHAVTEERPITLVIDDVHWSDDVSTRVIAGLLPRLSGCRLLVVTTAREGTAPVWDAGDERAVRTALAPLDAAGVDALARGIAPVPEEPWSASLLAALVGSSGGLPLHVLESLAALVDQRLLVVGATGWRLGDVDGALAQACALLAARRGPTARVEALETDALAVLTALAIAGAPLGAGAVAAAADVRGSHDHLVALARRGLVRDHADGTWEPVHDSIREAVLATASAPVRAATGRALAARFCDESASAADGDRALLARSAAILVLVGAEDALPAVFARWRTSRRRAGDHRADRLLAADLLGDAGSESRVARLLAARPVRDRLGLGSWRAAAATTVAAFALTMAVGAGKAVASHGARGGRPTRLALLAAPISWRVGMPMTPVPIVEVQDERGDPLPSAADSMRVQVLDDGAIVSAPDVAPVVRGRAVLDAVLLARAGAGSRIHVRFAYPGVPPLDVSLPSDGLLADSLARLRLVRAAVAGQVLTPERRVARVSPGASLDLELDVRYTSPWPAANVVLGAAPSWGDASTTFVRLASLVTPARDFALHTRTRLVAPRAPGEYHVVLAFGAEENVGYLLSGTNWTAGRAIWHDGNDVATWSAAQRAEADRAGSAAATLVRAAEPSASGIVTGDPGLTRVAVRVPATTLTLVVARR